MLAGMVADAVIARGLQGRVTLSHLCVLSALERGRGSALIEKIARAGVTVVALPETNLFLQDRGESEPGPARRHARPRAPRRRREGSLRHRQCAGLVLSLRRRRHARDRAVRGSRGASRRPRLSCVGAICDGRRAIAEGEPADLVLMPASSFDDALARRPAGRIVFKAGRQVAGPRWPGQRRVYGALQAASSSTGVEALDQGPEFNLSRPTGRSRRSGSRSRQRRGHASPVRPRWRHR